MNIKPAKYCSEPMSQMKHLLPLMMTVLLFAGCATPPISISSQPPHLISIPEPGVVTKAELGDTIVAKGIIYYWKGVTLKNQLHGRFNWQYPADASPGFYREYAQDSNWIYYSNGGICFLGLSKTDSNDLRLVGFTAAKTYHNLPNQAPKFELSEEMVAGSQSFKQELIYNGKSGNVLKFLYRELSGDTLRYPFSQDVQYDLADGNIIGFKGARLEVVEASNTKLEYKLIANFPEK